MLMQNIDYWQCQDPVTSKSLLIVYYNLVKISILISKMKISWYLKGNHSTGVNYNAL